MEITWDDVVAIAPELAALSAEAKASFLAHVNASFNLAAFSDDPLVATPQLRLARILLGAHLGTLGIRAQSSGGGTGEVTSETVGGISRTFKVSSSAEVMEGLDLSAYGQMLGEIINASAARAWILLGG